MMTSQLINALSIFGKLQFQGSARNSVDCLMKPLSRGMSKEELPLEVGKEGDNVVITTKKYRGGII